MTTTAATPSTGNIIDNAPYGRFHKKLVLLSAGGPFLDGYILGNLGIVVIGLQRQLGLGDGMLGLAGAAALIGLFLGGIGFGRLTDVIGRKLMYTVDLSVLLVGSILCVFIQEGWQLVVLRIILGIAVGADYPIATSMLSEWLPSKERGKAMGMLMGWYFVGGVAANLVGWIFISFMGDGAWRWVLASSAVPALFIMIARHGTPESPRWLISNGHREQARVNITAALDRPVTEAELDHLEESETREGLGFWDAFRAPYGKRTMFVCLFWACQIIPLFALYTYGPTILDQFGLDDDSAAGALLISVIFLVGIAPGLWLIDRIGRRNLIVWSFFLMSIPLFLLGFIPHAAGIVAILAFCAYALFSGGPSILEWAYPTELFPTEIRGTAVGIATSASRIGAAVGTYLVPMSIAGVGLGTTMLIGGVITFLGFLVCLAWAPETKGKSLKEASQIDV